MISVNPEAYLSHRPVKEYDIPLICDFPQSEQELYFMFPKAVYPLTVEQLRKSIQERFDSTVVLLDEEVAGFANFYRCEPGESCTIGNVIVRPDARGKGVGKYLINTMIEIAVKKYRVKNVRLSVFIHNTGAVLLYHRLGFKPVSFEERVDKHGRPDISIQMQYDIPPGNDPVK